MSPASILTIRTRFSPRKFLISISLPSSSMLTPMGKWAYTRRILYWKPYVTPLNKFCVANRKRVSVPSVV